MPPIFTLLYAFLFVALAETKLSEKLNQIALSVIRFKEESRRRLSEPTQANIDSLRALMEHVDGSISAYKQQHHVAYQQLCDEEKLLAKELDIYEKKIAAWAAAGNSDAHQQQQQQHAAASGKRAESVGSNNNNGSELLKEVLDFDVSSMFKMK